MNDVIMFVNNSKASFDVCAAEKYETAPKLDLAAVDAAKRAAAARVAVALSFRRHFFVLVIDRCTIWRVCFCYA